MNKEKQSKEGNTGNKKRDGKELDKEMNEQQWSATDKDHWK